MSRRLDNNIIRTDSYKASHFLGFPLDTQKMFSYFESRGGDYAASVFFGLQYYLKEYLSDRTRWTDVDSAGSFFNLHGEPFNHTGWSHIRSQHGGNLPVVIRAVKEGSVIPSGNVLMTIESTCECDDEPVFWLVNWLETMLVKVWYPTTVATRSYYSKLDIRGYLDQTSDDPAAEIPFKLHDFGGRGASSEETAEIGGMAHLVNFLGSDTVAGVWTANEFYGVSGGMAGFSIPAAEHATITAWGKEREVDAYRNMLTQFAKPGAMVAVVSDSYDVRHAAEVLWGETLRQEVIDSGATVIVRPDSGDPPSTVLDVMQILDNKFGSTPNSKGYRVLNHNVRMIQGDGMDERMIRKVLDGVVGFGYSATNLAFGMGGGLLQDMTRDTGEFALKCSQVRVSGVDHDVWKEAPGKESKRGRLDLIREDRVYKTVPIPDGLAEHPESEMVTVFSDGLIRVDWTLDQVRERTGTW